MKQLKKRIDKSGIKRKDLAKKLGVSYQYLNLWLNDFADMPEEYEKKINEILDSAAKN
ncbi:MAG TPA: helix-turn-helix transcriptional regulator [Patescibacteria group bacterium]|nr:helix-turn-helix transcriptional regulator [Patescibacteria group bacterium]